MSNVKFTPGPWEVQHEEDRDGCHIFWVSTPHESTVAKCFNPDNANFITAAPDMYEALRHASQFIENGIALGYITMPDADSGDSALDTPDIIFKALLKAQGGES